ncbi:hypothetical protein ACFL45_07055 [Candidatus Neomarinimicrobiota bacterium]
MHGSAHFQMLQSVVNVDTRQLFTTSYELPGTQSSRYLKPLMLSAVVRPKIQTETSYDDVYREQGTSHESTVYRMESISYIEIPLGAKRGGIGLEFIHTDAYANQSPQSGEESTVKWSDQRVSVGIGGNARQRKLRFGSQAGFTRLDQEWWPHYTAELSWQPQMSLNLALNTGRQPRHRSVEWQAENKRYPGDLNYVGSWWGATVRFGFLAYTNLMVEIQHERLRPSENPDGEGGFALRPEILSRSLRARAQIRPSAVSSLYFKWYVSSVTGTGEAFHDSQAFGDLRSLVVDNSDLEFIGTYRRSKRSLYVFTFSHCNLDSRQSGHIDPWPFTASVFSEIDSIDYQGHGQVRAERLIAEYIHSRRRSEAALQIGYVWLVPDYELIQTRTILTLIKPELVNSMLNISRAELIAVGGRLSVPLGRMTVTYSVNQAFPTLVEKRDVPAIQPTDEKTQIRGGTYHRIRLTFLL